MDKKRTGGDFLTGTHMTKLGKIPQNDYFAFMKKTQNPPTGIQEILVDLFSKHFGTQPAAIHPLAGDGSDRKLFRMQAAGRTAVGVYGPHRKENRAFLYFCRFFQKHGLPVPQIYSADPDRGVYLLQDLGDTTLYDLHKRQGFNPTVRALYRKAMQWLVQFQIPAGRFIDTDYCYQTKTFGRQAMLLDLRNFSRRFLQYESLPAGLLRGLEDDYNQLTGYLCGERRDFFLYRDFQSRNIMVLNHRLYFIDFQSGRKGALQYDPASLLYDSNLVVPHDLKQKLFALYIKEANKVLPDRPLDLQTFTGYYDGFALLRIMQAIGAFSFLWRIKGKQFFKANIPRGLSHIAHLMGNKTVLNRLPALQSVFKELFERWEVK